MNLLQGVNPEGTAVLLEKQLENANKVKDPEKISEGLNMVLDNYKLLVNDLLSQKINAEKN